MEKKRLLGVTIFGIICLTMSVPMLMVYSIVMLLTFPDFLKQSILELITLVFIPITLTVLLLLAGIGVLRLKEWGRRSAVFFSFLWLLSNVGLLLMVCIYTILGKVYVLSSPILVSFYVLFLTLLMFSLYFFRYFLRPKVKEQFK